MCVCVQFSLKLKCHLSVQLRHHAVIKLVGWVLIASIVKFCVRLWLYLTDRSPSYRPTLVYASVAYVVHTSACSTDS